MTGVGAGFRYVQPGTAALCVEACCKSIVPKVQMKLAEIDSAATATICGPGSRSSPDNAIASFLVTANDECIVHPRAPGRSQSIASTPLDLKISRMRPA